MLLWMSGIVRLGLERDRRMQIVNVKALGHLFALIASFLISGCVTGVTANGDYDGFNVQSLSLAKNIEQLQSENGEAITQFNIEPGCTTEIDCVQNSVRAELVEDVYTRKIYGRGQPEKAWYGWEIYLPADFPNSTQQGNGMYLLGQWHNAACPNLSVVNRVDENSVGFYLQRWLGGYDCEDAAFVPLVSLSQMRGNWTRFEFEIFWDDDEGFVNAYVNGVLRGSYTGRTLVAGFEDKLNNFRYGIYLCCTADSTKVIPTYARYRRVSRSFSRDELLVNAN
jgi:hypothetical protein